MLACWAHSPEYHPRPANQRFHMLTLFCWSLPGAPLKNGSRRKSISGGDSFGNKRIAGEEGPHLNAYSEGSFREIDVANRRYHKQSTLGPAKGGMCAVGAPCTKDPLPCPFCDLKPSCASASSDSARIRRKSGRCGASAGTCSCGQLPAQCVRYRAKKTPPSCRIRCRPCGDGCGDCTAVQNESRRH